MAIPAELFESYGLLLLYSVQTHLLEIFQLYRVIQIPSSLFGKKSSHLRNKENKNNPNAAACELELIPNNSLEEKEPVCFAIKFITDGILIEYTFSADLGKFLLQHIRAHSN